MKNETIITLQNKIRKITEKLNKTEGLTFKHRLLVAKREYLRALGREKFGVTIT